MNNLFQELVEHFGSQAELARQLGLTRGAVNQWKRPHGIPRDKALQIDRMTDGEISAMDVLEAAEK